MTRQTAIEAARAMFDTGAFRAALADLVATPTDSLAPDAAPALRHYLDAALGPRLDRLGFSRRIVEGPEGGLFLIAERREDGAETTVLSYGHGDTVPAMEGRWREGLSPLKLTAEGDRLYGRGTADNKGQHLINLMAMEAALTARGRLGFNIRLLIEMGEETGSPGLHALCLAERDALQADALIASDGPRVRPDRPTLFMGARGAVTFDLTCAPRDGAHHSGNWGGLISDPCIRLAQAIAAITDARGVIRVPEWRPGSLTPDISAALNDAGFGPPPGGPEFDADWGEPGLSAAEKVAGWNSFAVLAMLAGDPDRPANAIQPRAWARCQLRFVVGTAMDDIVPALRRHLAREGFSDIAVEETDKPAFSATRLAPDHPWVRWAAASVARTTGAPPAIMPNMGGSLPNEEFAATLGMPTIWVPHSYSGCSQHAPNEHLLAPVAREALGIMAGLWWDLGDGAPGARSPS